MWKSDIGCDSDRVAALEVAGWADMLPARDRFDSYAARHANRCGHLLVDLVRSWPGEYRRGHVQSCAGAKHRSILGRRRLDAPILFTIYSPGSLGIRIGASSSWRACMSTNATRVTEVLVYQERGKKLDMSIPGSPVNWHTTTRRPLFCLDCNYVAFPCLWERSCICS